MSYLRLSNETTNSCDYKVKLSSPFNQDNYREIRITSTDYGKSASRIKRYVAYKDAPNSGTSCYVRGVIDDGMSAGRTYTLYAYAQAANGTWYLAGEDTITTLDNSGGKYDYGFKSVEITTEEPYNIGDEIRIVANVKNYKSSAGSDYKVEVRDKNGALQDRDYENALDGKDTDNAYLYPVLEQDQVEDGYIEYTVYIKADESGWTEADDINNEETIRIQISADGDDDFSSATKISFGEKITGTIDQDNDQDYYLIDDVPSDCDVFLVMIDYDDVPHDGDYDCDIYVYDDRENLMGKVNGTPAGLTYMKVPATGSKHYVRVDFDGDFTSKKRQKYNLSTMAIPTIRVEQTNNINTAAEIHEGMHFLQNIKGDEKDYYKIIPVADRKLRFVVQPDYDRDRFLVKVLDKNKSILASESGRNPLKVEYDLKAGEQYYIEVAPETKDCFVNSIYLMYVEIDGVGGVGVPTTDKKFSLKENESKDNSISGYTAHQYFITFDKGGRTNFYFEKTSGDLIVQMDIYKDFAYPCSSQMLTDSGYMLYKTSVKAGETYRLVIVNLVGSGSYFVRCKNNSIICSNNYLSYNDMKINAAYIYHFLIAEGWTKNAIAALLGNMQTESNINPGIWQSLKKDNMKGGFGLVQWTPATKLIDWADNKGLDYEDIDTQLERILLEVEEDYLQWSKNLNDFDMSFKEFTKSTKNVSDLTKVFLKSYEKAGVEVSSERIEQAEKWFNWFDEIE